MECILPKNADYNASFIPNQLLYLSAVPRQGRSQASGCIFRDCRPISFSFPFVSKLLDNGCGIKNERIKIVESQFREESVHSRNLIMLSVNTEVKNTKFHIDLDYRKCVPSSSWVLAYSGGNDYGGYFVVGVEVEEFYA